MNNEELILQMLGKISDKLEEHDKHFESIDMFAGLNLLKSI